MHTEHDYQEELNNKLTLEETEIRLAELFEHFLPFCIFL